MNESVQAWAVDGQDLQTPSRRGGKVALKGFEFQAAHAVHFITQLLTCKSGLVRVRYEGAQDVDVLYGKDRQVCIQYKETGHAEYTFKAMRSILHGFMRDVIDACGTPFDVARLSGLTLEFVFVSTGVIVGTDMLRLIRRSYTPGLAAKLAKGFGYKKNPVTSANDLKSVATYVLEHISVRLNPTFGDLNEPALLAYAQLAMFGVPPANIPASIAKIKELLTPPRNTFSADVAGCLDGLPEHHPANRNSPVKMLPSENLFPAKSLVEQDFRESGRGSWPVIHYGLDVARDIASAIHQAFLDFGKSAGLLLLTGAGASGKSTLIRRVAWEIHRSGLALVYEVTNPIKLDSQVWDEAVRLSALANKPALVVIDDIGNYPQAFEELSRTPHSNVIVIASDKSRHCIPDWFNGQVSSHALASVSDNELALLIEQAGTVITPEQKRKLANFQTHGEIFALSLVVRGSSLQELAAVTMRRLEAQVPPLRQLFLSLCACGVYDQVVPTSLLYRIEPDMRLWTTAKKERLVFDEGDSRLRSGHALLAKAVLATERPDVERLKITLLESVDTGNLDELRFALGLLQNGLIEHVQGLARFPGQLGAFATSVSKVANYSDLWRCARIVDAVTQAGATGLEQARRDLAAVTGPERVRTGHDAVRFMRSECAYATAFPVVAAVFAKPEVRFGRRAFMRWVSENGDGRIDLKRQAIKIQLAWLEANNFPVPETEALVDCMVHVRTPLPVEAVAEFIGVLRLVLDHMEFNPHNRQGIHLLHAVSEAIRKQLRDEKLFWTLFEGVRGNFTNEDLAGNAQLMRYLLTTARLAGQQLGRTMAFSLIAPLVDMVESEAIRSVIRALTSCCPDRSKTFMVGWARRFEQLKPNAAAELAKDFVVDVALHLAA